MFRNLRKKLYQERLHLLFQEGKANGEILPFEDELFERLNHVYLNGIPITFHLKYIRPIPHLQPGQCYDRSLWITMGMDDAVLVRGDNKDLEFAYGKENAGHGWVEKDGWVYDTSLLLKIKKERYYQMYLPSHVHYYSYEEYSNREWYQDIISTTLDDLKADGFKRFWLSVTIPPIEDIASKSHNSEFQDLLKQHLESIHYDYDEISSSFLQQKPLSH